MAAAMRAGCGTPYYSGDYSPAYYGGYSDDGCYVRRFRVSDGWGWYWRSRVVCY
jgi:hypothetical protein